METLGGVAGARFMCRMWREKLVRDFSHLFIVGDCRWREEKVAQKWKMSRDRGGVVWCRCKSLGSINSLSSWISLPRKKENMPAQDYNEDLTELMKESPTTSWVLEGDKGKTCNRIIHEFSSLRWAPTPPTNVKFTMLWDPSAHRKRCAPRMALLRRN